MRILVAGATGAIGLNLVPQLIAAGHSVVGTTRTAAKTELIRRMGAEPAVVDGLDAAAIRSTVLAAGPDVIVDQMTDLAAVTDLRHFDRAFSTTNQLRTQGTDFLLAAAREAGVKRFIAQSFCGWTYGRSGAAVKTETDALDVDPPEELRPTLEAIQYLESAVAGSTSVEGIVLRYGSFYGPGTGMLSRPMIDQVRRRRVPLIGGGGGRWSFIHVEDAASATLAAIERGKPGEIYNIVDDEPAEVSEWLPALATLVGARPPIRVPAWLGRLFAGEHLVSMMTEVRAGSNAKAKRELGWQPTHPSWRQGFAEVASGATAQRAA
ncbi:NAD(P)-dependent oxidoreductase [Bradyrhizobium sp. CB3481]|uniref:NAD-dependent epimerase/dehydratase family protein n=1 Tax=Bradyrhizobium sp. CB3481 TaxID=3039158 RepID=UPI0024B227E9|nr:NAD(P)-dependent oxidoreductase [Bradyrhizobium sp. CB3481]WFU15655.1 NAD(P)-dependent oxidoreductase [Bradyrhizobium sp. CB3481]